MAYLRNGMLIAALAAGSALPAHAADHLARARQLLAKGDLRGAQIELRNAVRDEPANAAAHYQLATTDLELGDAAAAEREAREARRTGYDAAATTLLLVRSYLAQGRGADLLKEFTVGPHDAPAVAANILVGRGLALLARGDLDQAQAALAEAERLAPTSPEPPLAQAQLALARNDPAAAARALDRALARDPRSVEARLRQAALLERQGNQAGALAAYDAAIAAAPDAYAARLGRAGILIASGQFAKAKADVDATLAALPGSVLGIYLRAVLLIQAGNYQAADAELDRISSMLGRLQRGYFYQALVKQRLGQLQQAAEAADRYAARNPGDVNGAKLRAVIELQMKQPGRAIDTLDRLARSDTRDWGLYDLLGRAYEMTGNLGLAAAALQKAVTLAPDNVALRNRLAALRLQIGDASGAARDLERSLQLVPAQPEAEQMLMGAALASGDTAGAASEVDKLRRQLGDTAAVGTTAGLIKLARLDLDGARAQFEAVLKAHPDWLPAALGLAKVEAIQGHAEASHKLLAEILARHPDNTLALTNLISELLAAGQGAAAARAAEAAHQAAPGNVVLTLGLARLYLRIGEPKKAAALVDALGESQLPAPSLLGLRAEVAVALGRKAEAQELYRQILEISPADLAARLNLARLLLAAKDDDGARATLAAGLGKQPGNYELLSGLVAVALKTGGLKAALAEAEALRQQPGNLPAAALLPGDLYMSQKRFGEAAAAYSAAMKAAPSQPLALALARALAAAGEPDQARAALGDWLARHPDDIAATEMLAGLELAANRLADAKAHFLAVLQRNPNDAAALNDLAWIYQKEGDPRARSLAEHAFMLSPVPQIADTLGWILTEQGDARTGLLLLRDAAARAPDNVTMRYHLAVALKDTGERQEAIKLLAQVAAAPGNFPDKPAARRMLDELAAGK